MKQMLLLIHLKLLADLNVLAHIFMLIIYNI